MKKILSSILSMVICIAILPVLPASAASVFDGGDGTFENPYLISNETQLKAIMNEPKSYYTLNNNIEISQEWVALGSSSTKKFSGTLNGNGYSITNLQIKDNREYMGLFAVNNGVIENLKISLSDTVLNLSSDSSAMLGIIAGINNGIINNCFTQGYINYSNNDSSAKSYIGGIAGQNNGYINNSSSIFDCTADGEYGSPYYDLCNCAVGGIAGENTLYINNCVSRGNLNIRDFYSMLIGGIAGRFYGEVKNSYYMGKISADEGYFAYAGGIVGFISNSNNKKAIINQCYAVNSFTNMYGRISYPYKSGIAGNYKNASIILSYFDKSVSGLTESVSEEGYGYETSKLKFKNTYTSWDFDTIWAIDAEHNDGYPYLQWEYPSEPEPTPEPDSIVVEIVDVAATDNSLKFISAVGITGTPEVDSFGTTFIPLSLFDDESAKTAKVSYDNYDYDIQNGQTYGATLSGIPESCKDWQFVGKSYVKDADRNYVWSVARSASINDTILNTIE